MPEKYESLIFNYNWNNKLGCNHFTSLRLHNDNKFTIGKIFEIYFKKKFDGLAKLIDKRVICFESFNKFITYLDTGYDVEETKNIFRKMYSKSNVDIENAKFDFLLFKREK